jgi:hypothetical protein
MFKGGMFKGGRDPSQRHALLSETQHSIQTRQKQQGLGFVPLCDDPEVRMMMFGGFAMSGAWSNNKYVKPILEVKRV